MSFEDRDWASEDNPMGRSGRPGGDYQGIPPSLDNPMTWALPLGRFMGIAIRVHLIFLIVVVVQLLIAATVFVPDGELEFPNRATLTAYLEPANRINGSDEFIKVIVPGRENTIQYSAITGRTEFRARPPLERLEAHLQQPGIDLRIEGSTVTCTLA